MKNKLKYWIIKILSTYPFDILSEFWLKDRVTVFYLHRFEAEEQGDHDVDAFKPERLQAVLDYFKAKNYALVSLEDVVNKKLPKSRRAVAFTMDDGFLDQAKVAAPIFIRNQCPVTIFLITGFLDGKHWPWDDQLMYGFMNSRLDEVSLTVEGEAKRYQLTSTQARKAAAGHFRDYCKRLSKPDMLKALQEFAQKLGVELDGPPPSAYTPLSWGDARELEQQGVRFGPHSVSHYVFASLDDDAAQDEIAESTRRLQEELAHPLPIFAWPTGRKQDYTERDCQLLAEAGIKAAFSTVPGHMNLAQLNVSGHQKFQFNRFVLPENDVDLMQYSSWIEPFKSWLRSVLR